MSEELARDQVLGELRRVREAYTRELLSVPTEVAYQRPAEEAWSIGEIAAHMAEYSAMIRSGVLQMRDESDPLVGRAPGDPKRLAAVAEHGRDPLDSLAAEVNRIWEDLERVALALDDQQWQRECRHRRYGSVTPASFLARQPAHFVEHTEEIARLKRGMGDRR